MIIYNVKHNFKEIGQYEMDAQLENKKLTATIFQEEIISPFRKRLTSNKTGVVSYTNGEEINPAHWTDEIEQEFLTLRNQAQLLPTYSKLGPLSYFLMVVFSFLLFILIQYGDFEGSSLGKAKFEKEFLSNPSTNAALILETTRKQKTIPYEVYHILDIKGDTVIVSNPGGMVDLKDKVAKFDANDKRKPLKISKSKMLEKEFQKYGNNESRPIIEIRKESE